MARLIVFLVLVACIIYVYRLQIRAWFSFRRKGEILPLNGKQATLFDVRRLIVMGEIDMAVELYGEIYKVSPKEAATEVQLLLQTIRQKNTEKE